MDEKRNSRQHRIFSARMTVVLSAAILAAGLMMAASVGSIQALAAEEKSVVDPDGRPVIGEVNQALIIGNQSYSEEELRYCYRSVVEQFLSGANGYESLLGLDVSRPFSEQNCTLAGDGSSWEDYFMGEALSMLTYISGAFQEAGAFADAVRPDAETYAERMITSYRKLAEKAGFASLDEYLSAEVGIDEAGLRRLTEQAYVGDRYAEHVKDSLVFTDEDLAEYYRNNADRLRKYSYLYVFAGAQGYGSTSQAACVEKLRGANTEQEFRRLAKDLTGSEAITISGISAEEIGNPDAEDARWITDSRRTAGDRYVGINGADQYVLYWLSADDNGYPGSEEDDAEWKNISRENLIQRAFEAWKTSLIEKYGAES